MAASQLKAPDFAPSQHGEEEKRKRKLVGWLAVRGLGPDIRRCSSKYLVYVCAN
jgi:hypothetical protein